MALRIAPRGAPPSPPPGLHPSVPIGSQAHRCPPKHILSDRHRAGCGPVASPRPQQDDEILPRSSWFARSRQPEGQPALALRGLRRTLWLTRGSRPCWETEESHRADRAVPADICVGDTTVPPVTFPILPLQCVLEGPELVRCSCGRSCLEGPPHLGCTAGQGSPEHEGVGACSPHESLCPLPEKHTAVG